MTATEVLTIISAIITACGGLAVLIINALSNAKRDLMTLQHDLAAQAAAQGDKIHDLVNGNATRAAEKLDTVEGQLASLRTELTRLQEQRVEDAKTREARNQ